MRRSARAIVVREAGRFALLAGVVLAILAPAAPALADAPAYPVPSAIPPVAATVAVEGFGEFTIVLDRDAVPNHVACFLSLAAEGWYSGLEFHRVIPRYLVQTGDPATRAAPEEEGAPPLGPTERPAFRLPAEPSPRTHERGTVSMAWRDDDPGTASTEWFVTLDDVPALDDRATPIGRVVSGMDVVDGIAQVSTHRDRRPREPVRITEIRLGPEPADSAAVEPPASDPPAVPEAPDGTVADAAKGSTDEDSTAAGPTDAEGAQGVVAEPRPGSERP